MAKQNVTFFERHLEKLVVGVCGLGLLAVAWLYLINSPNVVVVGGESIGPKEYYGKFEQAAEDAARKAKSKTPDQRPKPAVTQITQNPRPYDALSLSDRLVAFVPPSPVVPDIGKPRPGTGTGVRVVDILPPVRPLLTTNHGTAKLPEKHIEVIGEPPPTGGPSIAPASSQDVTWVAMLSAVDRKAQREAFQAAGYAELRLSLIVTEVQAERQQLLAGGQWGDPEAVTAFATWGVKGPQTLVRIKNETTGYEEIPSEQLKVTEEFRQKFSAYEKEQLILRPPFQESIDEWWQWTLPKTLPGHPDVDVSEVGVRFREITKKVRPTAPGPRTNPKTPPAPRAGTGAAGARGNRAADKKGPTPPPAPKKPPEKQNESASAAKDAIEAIKEAEKAFKDKDPLKAEKILQALLDKKLAPASQMDKAQKLLDEKAGEIEDAKAALALKEQNKAKKALYNYGPDIDPLWVTDTTAVPGATYRYRIRLVAYNAYAGLESMVADPKDATRVVLTGQWSEWSDPITTKPDRYLFFRKAADKQTAEFDIHQFSGGVWKQPATAKAAIGQPLTTGSGRSKIAYGAVVADVNLRVPYKERIEGRNGPIAYRDAAETHALTLVNARGEVEERLASDDVVASRDFGRDKAEEQKIREEMASTPGGPAPAPAAPGPVNLPAPAAPAPPAANPG